MYDDPRAAVIALREMNGKLVGGRTIEVSIGDMNDNYGMDLSSECFLQVTINTAWIL